MLSAYVLYPTVYYDGSPNQLSQLYRDQWVKLVAASHYAQVYDDPTVVELLGQVENPVAAVERLLGSAQGVEVAALQNVMPLAQQAGAGRTAPRDAGFFSSLMSFLIPLIVVAILTPILVVVWRLLIYPNIVAPLRERFRPKSEEELLKKKELEAEKAARIAAIELQKGMAKHVDEQLGDPVMQKLAIYTKGRAFDESFAIEDADEMFLGECGASKSKTLGDSNELAAVEIWLFDKEDFVRTLTKIFCSEHAYNDPAIRSELDNKVDDPANDIVVIRDGAQIHLDTNALRVTATVKSLTYGSTPGLPPNSHFEKLNIEIAAWQKAGKAVGIGTAPVMAAPPMPAPAPMPSYAPPPVQPAPQFAPPPSVQPRPLTPPPLSPQPMSPQTQPNPAMRPLSPPPLQPQPPRPAPQDDDPFGGTGDFTPLSNS
jgi:hypothetical protein